MNEWGRERTEMEEFMERDMAEADTKAVVESGICSVFVFALTHGSGLAVELPTTVRLEEDHSLKSSNTIFI